MECDSKCLECDGQYSNECIDCYSGYHIGSGTKDYCCDDSCNTCNGNADNNCLSCNYNNDGTFLNESTHTCETECAFHYYKKIANHTVINKL